jgi:hypothetical protein
LPTTEQRSKFQAPSCRRIPQAAASRRWPTSSDNSMPTTQFPRSTGPSQSTVKRASPRYCFCRSCEHHLECRSQLTSSQLRATRDGALMKRQQGPTQGGNRGKQTKHNCGVNTWRSIAEGEGMNVSKTLLTYIKPGGQAMTGKRFVSSFVLSCSCVVTCHKVMRVFLPCRTR